MKMKLKKPTHIVYDDMLTQFDTPLVDMNTTMNTHMNTPMNKYMNTPLVNITTSSKPDDVPVTKKKVVVKKKVPQEIVEAQVQIQERKVSTYNMFIKEKRQELLSQYPKLSKAEIYEMAKEAYRELKCT